MVLSSVFVLSNALRLRWVKPAIHHTGGQGDLKTIPTKIPNKIKELKP
jgi:hypothetical protein